MDGRRVKKVVREAVFAHDRGESTFAAGLDVDPSARVSMSNLRGAMDELISAVESVGWKCTVVESSVFAVEMVFIRL